jgi:hypothetical protein
MPQGKVAFPMIVDRPAGEMLEDTHVQHRFFATTGVQLVECQSLGADSVKPVQLPHFSNTRFVEMNDRTGQKGLTYFCFRRFQIGKTLFNPVVKCSLADRPREQVFDQLACPLVRQQLILVQVSNRLYVFAHNNLRIAVALHTELKLICAIICGRVLRPTKI